MVSTGDDALALIVALEAIPEENVLNYAQCSRNLEIFDTFGETKGKVLTVKSIRLLRGFVGGVLKDSLPSVHMVDHKLKIEKVNSLMKSTSGKTTSFVQFLASKKMAEFAGADVSSDLACKACKRPRTWLKLRNSPHRTSSRLWIASRTRS